MTHLPLELTCQIIGVLLSWAFFYYVWASNVILVEYDILCFLAFEVSQSLVVSMCDVRDSNHVAYRRLPKDPNVIFVGPEYHSLHHVDPQRYLGSRLKPLHWILGSTSSLQGRRVTMTYSRGAMGYALSQELQRAGVAMVQGLEYGRH